VGLYHFLLARTSLLAPATALPGGLGQVAATETADFPGRVLASTGKPFHRTEVPSSSPLWLAALAALVGLWISSAMELGSDVPAGVFGGIAGTFVICGLLFTAAFAARRGALKKMRSACGIVISPRSLTLESPALKGVLQWSEIKSIRSFSRNFSALRGVLIHLDGAQVLIGDDYACPLTEIHRVIQSHWSHERG
jgi:hypothetical protein